MMAGFQKKKPKSKYFLEKTEEKRNFYDKKTKKMKKLPEKTEILIKKRKL